MPTNQGTVMCQCTPRHACCTRPIGPKVPARGPAPLTVHPCCGAISHTLCLVNLCECHGLSIGTKRDWSNAGGGGASGGQRSANHPIGCAAHWDRFGGRWVLLRSGLLWVQRSEFMRVAVCLTLWWHLLLNATTLSRKQHTQGVSRPLAL